MREAVRPGMLFLGMIALCLHGCGGGGSDVALDEVSGTVTLDDAPLADATVIFTPTGGGRPTFGLTDSSGEYTIEYSSTSAGTPPGEYVVAIRTFRAPEEDPDTGEMKPAVPEKVPTEYNSPSTLTVTVPAESYDFDLKSSAGKLVQPKILED